MHPSSRNAKSFMASAAIRRGTDGSRLNPMYGVDHPRNGLPRIFIPNFLMINPVKYPSVSFPSFRTASTGSAFCVSATNETHSGVWKTLASSYVLNIFPHSTGSRLTRSNVAMQPDCLFRCVLVCHWCVVFNLIRAWARRTPSLAGRALGLRFMSSPVSVRTLADRVEDVDSHATTDPFQLSKHVPRLSPHRPNVKFKILPHPPDNANRTTFSTAVPIAPSCGTAPSVIPEKYLLA